MLRDRGDDDRCRCSAPSRRRFVRIRPRGVRSAARLAARRCAAAGPTDSPPLAPSASRGYAPRVFITFLSDFGLKDDFVGTCHGVMKRIAPEAEIIDITHGIPRDVHPAGCAGAREHDRLHARRRPPRDRRPRRGRPASALVLRDAEGRLYVGPDNGLLCRRPVAAASRRRTSSPTPSTRSTRSRERFMGATSSRRLPPTSQTASRSRSSGPRSTPKALFDWTSPSPWSSTVRSMRRSSMSTALATSR